VGDASLFARPGGDGECMNGDGAPFGRITPGGGPTPMAPKGPCGSGPPRPRPLGPGCICIGDMGPGIPLGGRPYIGIETGMPCGGGGMFGIGRPTGFGGIAIRGDCMPCGLGMLGSIILDEPGSRGCIGRPLTLPNDGGGGMRIGPDTGRGATPGIVDGPGRPATCCLPGTAFP
jgi:hypothetical protein